jgi:multiple sugar transport system substrate-binding protein/putative aldouronate transport system substrate-binding protein
VDDIENAARVFKQRLPAGAATIPIIGPDKSGFLYRTFINSGSNNYTFDPVFNSGYDVYPGYFHDNGNGTVSYGSLDPKMKPALERLTKWYKEGLIDPELGTRDSSVEVINANQAGMFFGAWWTIGYNNGDSFKNNPHANWQAYPVFDGNGKWNASQKASGAYAIAISRKASPDVAAAVIKIYSSLASDTIMRRLIDGPVNSDWIPLRCDLAFADYLEVYYHAMEKILKKEAEPEDYKDFEFTYSMIYQDGKSVRDVIPGYSPNRDLTVEDFNLSAVLFQSLYSRMVGVKPFAVRNPDKEVYSLTYGMTDLLEQRWPNLYKMEQ